MFKVLSHTVVKRQDWHVDGDTPSKALWALLKRSMFSHFHSVGRKHLRRYVDESYYRYSLRNTDPFKAFNLTLDHGLGGGVMDNPSRKLARIRISGGVFIPGLHGLYRCT